MCVFLQVASLQQSHQPEEQTRQASQWRKNMKAIKNLLIIVVLFNVCWTPFLILCIVMSYNPDYYEPRLAHWYDYFLLLFSLNSGMNPIVYAARFRPFQVAFKLMFGCIKNEHRAKVILDVN